MGEIIISKNILEEEKDVYVKTGIVAPEYNFWVGLVMDKFYDGLENKKFIGSKCSKCGKVFLPPRKTCGDCFAKAAEEFVELPETGIVKNFTVANYNVNERKARKLKEPIIVGLVQVDGADTAMINRVINITPDEIKEGMRVKVVWADKIKGHPKDIKGFEPIGGD
jgi:uncharacterized OB-fold protein